MSSPEIHIEEKGYNTIITIIIPRTWKAVTECWQEKLWWYMSTKLFTFCAQQKEANQK